MLECGNGGSFGPWSQGASESLGVVFLLSPANQQMHDFKVTATMGSLSIHSHQGKSYDGI